MDFYKLRVGINYFTNGWTEIYNLRTAVLATAKKMAGFICAARARILPVGFSIKRNPMLSLALQFKDGVPVFGQFASYTGEVLLDLDDTTPEADFVSTPICNNPNVGLLYRYDCANGQYAYRAVRGLRDSWVADFTKSFTAQTTYYVNPDFTLPNTGNNSPYANFNALVAPFKISDALGVYLSTVRDACAIYNPTTPPPIVDYTQSVFAAAAGTDTVYQFQRMSERRGGKRVGTKRGKQKNWT